MPKGRKGDKMKYLIQNRKEFGITLGFFVLMAVDLFNKLKKGEVDPELIAKFIFYGFGVLAWFYNMPTSEENCEATGEMRARKAEKEGINGEYFYEEGKEQNDEPEDL